MVGRALVDVGFAGISNCWLAFLFTPGCLFFRESKYFISIGFAKDAAWGWQVQQLSDGVYLPAHGNMSLDEARDRLHEIVITNAKDFNAVPTSPCHYDGLPSMGHPWP